jgi:hypothetical protein
MPAAKPRRRKEVAVEIALGTARRRVWMRADRNAPAAFRQFVEGFVKEHALSEAGKPAPTGGDKTRGET